ncbi:MAG: hypothetical protein ACXIVG_04725 [Pararhodobacter sp.]
MPAWRSAPGGDRLLGWRGWVLGLLAAWMIPVWLGLGFLALWGLIERVAGPTPALAILGTPAFVMSASLMLAGLWLVPLALLAWALMRLGLGGWLPFALCGAATGAPGIMAMPDTSPALGAALGMMNALILRGVFGRLMPQVFTRH